MTDLFFFYGTDGDEILQNICVNHRDRSLTDLSPTLPAAARQRKPTQWTNMPRMWGRSTQLWQHLWTNIAVVASGQAERSPSALSRRTDVGAPLARSLQPFEHSVIVRVVVLILELILIAVLVVVVLVVVTIAFAITRRRTSTTTSKEMELRSAITRWVGECLKLHECISWVLHRGRMDYQHDGQLHRAFEIMDLGLSLVVRCRSTSSSGTEHENCCRAL